MVSTKFWFIGYIVLDPVLPTYLPTYMAKRKKPNREKVGIVFYGCLFPRKNFITHLFIILLPLWRTTIIYRRLL